jgi:hypothetical protein
MMRLEIREACFINGQSVEVGGEISVDDATAKSLILMRRAVAAADKPQPEEAPAPAARPRARTTAQPTAPKEA